MINISQALDQRIDFSPKTFGLSGLRFVEFHSSLSCFHYPISGWKTKFKNVKPDVMKANENVTSTLILIHFGFPFINILNFFDVE